MNLGLPLASETYVAGAATLALYAGATRVVCGLLKLGNVMTSLPVPLLQGFVSAATWMVFFSQVPAMVGGASGPLAGHFATAAFWLGAHPAAWHPGTAAMAAATFVIMLNGMKIHKLFPSALVCCVLGCVLAFNGFDIGGVVGAISAGRLVALAPRRVRRAARAFKSARGSRHRHGRDHVPGGRGGVPLLGGQRRRAVGLEQGAHRAGRGEHLRGFGGGMNVAGVIRDLPSASRRAPKLGWRTA